MTLPPFRPSVANDSSEDELSVAALSFPPNSPRASHVKRAQTSDFKPRPRDSLHAKNPLKDHHATNKADHGCTVSKGAKREKAARPAASGRRPETCTEEEMEQMVRNGQERFRQSMEALFAKFGNPHLDPDATDVVEFLEDEPMADEDPFVIIEDRGHVRRWREEDAALDDDDAGADTSSDDDEETDSGRFKTESPYVLPPVAKSDLTEEERRAIWNDTPLLPSDAMPRTPPHRMLSLSTSSRLPLLSPATSSAESSSPPPPPVARKPGEAVLGGGGLSTPRKSSASPYRYSPISRAQTSSLLSRRRPFVSLGPGHFLSQKPRRFRKAEPGVE